MGLTDEEESGRCPCCVECKQCKDFQRVVYVEDPGFAIYCHAKCVDDINKTTDIIGCDDMPEKDVFIYQNTGNVDIASADFMTSLDKLKITCRRCRFLLERAQKLLKRVPVINENLVMGICDHCYLKQFPKSCYDCDDSVKKFLAARHGQEDAQEMVETWLSKIKHLLKDMTSVQSKYAKSRAKSDLYIDKIAKSELIYSNEEKKSTRVPDWRSSDSNIPGSLDKLSRYSDSRTLGQKRRPIPTDQRYAADVVKAATREQTDYDISKTPPLLNNQLVTIPSQIRDVNDPTLFLYKTKRDNKSLGFIDSKKLQRKYRVGGSTPDITERLRFEYDEFDDTGSLMHKSKHKQKGEAGHRNIIELPGAAGLKKPEFKDSEGQLIFNKRLDKTTTYIQHPIESEFSIHKTKQGKHELNKESLHNMDKSVDFIDTKLEQKQSRSQGKAKADQQQRQIRSVYDELRDVIPIQKHGKHISKDISEVYFGKQKKGTDELSKPIIKREQEAIIGRAQKHSSVESLITSISRATQNTLGKELSFFFPKGIVSKKHHKLQAAASSTVLIHDIKKKFEEEKILKEAEKNLLSEKKRKNAEEKAERKRLAEEQKKIAEEEAERKRLAEEQTKFSKAEEEMKQSQKKLKERPVHIEKEEKSTETSDKKRKYKHIEKDKGSTPSAETKIKEDVARKITDKNIAPNLVQEQKKQNEDNKGLVPKVNKPTAKEATGIKSKNAKESQQKERIEPKTKDIKEKKPEQAKEPARKEVIEPKTKEIKEVTPKEVIKPKTKEIKEVTPKEQPAPKEVIEPKTKEIKKVTPKEVIKPKTKEIKEVTPIQVKEPTLEDIKELKAREVIEPKAKEIKDSSPTKVKETTPSDKTDFKFKDAKEPLKKEVIEPKTKEVLEPRTKEIEEATTKPGKDLQPETKETYKLLTVTRKEQESKRIEDEIQEKGKQSKKVQKPKDIKSIQKEEKEVNEKDFKTIANKEKAEQIQFKKQNEEHLKEPSDKKDFAVNKMQKALADIAADDKKMENIKEAKAKIKAESQILTIEKKRVLQATEDKKELNMNKIKVRKPSTETDDLIVRLVKLRELGPKYREKVVEKAVIKEHITKHKNIKTPTCIVCLDSDLELEVESIEMEKNKLKLADVIIGEEILKLEPTLEVKVAEKSAFPLFFHSVFDAHTIPVEQLKPRQTTEVETEEKPILPSLPIGKSAKEPLDPEATKGIIRYALSDRTFIEKGWTMLPTEKVVRKMNVYRMRPAQPQFDWFEHNKYKRLMQYDTGEKLAEFEDNGRGRWYYKNGHLALDYYDAEEVNAHQRFVIYSSGEPDERGRSRPITVLATFDYLGNGVVFDHGGKIRLKYNQTEGVVLDRGLGPVSHWKWHTLNDPPVLQQVMIDTQMAHKDPKIIKLGPADKKTRPDNEEMLAIEFDNFVKEKSKKLTQTFKPFQIKMKALKINEHFSLKVLDQATVYLIFRDGSANLKLNIGMVLDHKEIVDTDTAEVGEVSNSLERFPARTDSLAGMQRSVAYAQRFERTRTERDRRLRPQEPCASADQLTAATSRPLRPPFRTAPSGSESSSRCNCKFRKPSSCNLYYNTRLS